MHILIFVFGLFLASMTFAAPHAVHHGSPIHTMDCGDSGGGVPGGRC